MGWTNLSFHDRFFILTVLLKKSNILFFPRPHLEYANQVWDPYLVKDCKLLDDVQKFYCKVCLKSWNTIYGEMPNSLNIPKLEQRRKAHKSQIVFYAQTCWNQCSSTYASNSTTLFIHHSLHPLQTAKLHKWPLYTIFFSKIGLWNK